MNNNSNCSWDLSRVYSLSKVGQRAFSVLNKYVITLTKLATETKDGKRRFRVNEDVASGDCRVIHRNVGKWLASNQTMDQLRNKFGIC